MNKSNRDFIEEEREVDLPTLEDTEERREYSSDEPAFLKSIDDHTKTLKLDAVEVTMQPEENREPIEEDDEDKGYLVKRVLLLIVLAVILVGLGIFAVLSNRQDEENLAEQRQQQIAEETPETPTPSATPVPTSTPEVVETPEATTPEPVQQYGTAVINAELIKRDQPSLSGTAVGSAYAGESYQVINMQEAEGYTWYQLSDNTWVASEGTWVTYQ